MNRIALIIAALLAVPLFAQTRVSVVETPALDATESRYYRDASSNLEYLCTTLATQPEAASWTRSLATTYQPKSSIAQATLTNIVDAANTSTVTTSGAHGLSVGQWVTISGATVDSDLNGTYVIATVGSSTTFTVTTASVSDATMNESTLKVATVAPRTNAYIWAVRKFYYTTTYIDREVPAKGTNAMVFSCDGRVALY
jgi:hypothetical protein